MNKQDANFDRINIQNISNNIEFNMKYRVYLEARTGVRLSLATGELETGHEDRMTTLHFYKAVKGSRLHLLSKDYAYAIATYSLCRDMTYIYTYAYQTEENWTTYNHDLTPDSYRQLDYEFDGENYFRINLKRIDGNSISDLEAKKVNEILQYISIDEEYTEKAYYGEEIMASEVRIREKKNENSMTFAILTDTHYTVNGTWEDTAYNLKALNNEVGFDAVIHLGDFTDGLVSCKVLKDYVMREIRDIQELKVPFYLVLGNHDSNYFRNNPERMTEKEQQEFYFGFIDQYINRNSNQSYYYVDYEKIKLRGIFLKSYDFDQSTKYGFDETELRWLQEILTATPKGYSVILFSHVPPIAVLHYWTDIIRNEEPLMDILETYNSKEENQILAYIHGHNHADQIYLNRSFPIISIGCAKCEYFTDKKPEGSFTYDRALDTVTQELWDTLIVTPKEKRIDLIRFGAGKDRTVILEKNEIKEYYDCSFNRYHS